jgi:hypothetical protein
LLTPYSAIDSEMRERRRDEKEEKGHFLRLYKTQFKVDRNVDFNRTTPKEEENK